MFTCFQPLCGLDSQGRQLFLCARGVEISLQMLGVNTRPLRPIPLLGWAGLKGKPWSSNNISLNEPRKNN